VWDDVGNLTVAYNKVQILYTNETVTLERGAHAPSRVLTGALADQPGAGARTIWFMVASARVLREGAQHHTRGACAPHSN